MSGSLRARALVFDLDDTLAPSKSPLSDAMGAVLAELLAAHTVAVISGGRWEQFEAQLVRRLPAHADLGALHLLPTCGAAYLRWRADAWHTVHADVLTDAEVRSAASAIEDCARRLGLWEAEVWGERIENRGAQVTFSALGQLAPLEAKRGWDPDGAKKERLRACVAAAVPGLEVRSGGSTSVDITRAGVDKAFGVRRFMAETGLGVEAVTFYGDRLDVGGNDYPVRSLGIRCIEVADDADTLARLVEYLSR